MKYSFYLFFSACVLSTALTTTLRTLSQRSSEEVEGPTLRKDEATFPNMGDAVSSGGNVKIPRKATLGELNLSTRQTAKTTTRSKTKVKGAKHSTGGKLSKEIKGKKKKRTGSGKNTKRSKGEGLGKRTKGKKTAKYGRGKKMVRFSTDGKVSVKYSTGETSGKRTKGKKTVKSYKGIKRSGKGKVIKSSKGAKKSKGTKRKGTSTNRKTGGYVGGRGGDEKTKYCYCKVAEGKQSKCFTIDDKRRMSCSWHTCDSKYECVSSDMAEGSIMCLKKVIKERIVPDQRPMRDGYCIKVAIEEEMAMPYHGELPSSFYIAPAA